MPLAGSLETFNIANLLQFFSVDQKTGVLQISGGGKTVKIFIKRGFIVYVTSSRQEFRLGHFLRSREVISEEKLQECLQLAKERNQQLGRVLVEQGYISKSSLKDFLYLQAEEILYDVFLWEAGDFEYTDIPINVKGKLFIPLNPMGIIMEASRRIDERSIITREIPSEQLIFKISKKMGDTEKAKLTKNEWRILSLMDGSRTVKQVINDSAYAEFATYKIIYSLAMSGFIEKTWEEESDIVYFIDIINIFNNIFHAVCKALEPELGTMALTIFADCKVQLSPEQQNLLQYFDVGTDAASNWQALLEAIDAFQDLRQGRTLLIQSFNALLRNIINKETETLGTKITQSTLNEIKQILSYIKEYQRDSTEKIRPVYEIETSLENLLHKTQNKKKAEGNGDMSYDEKNSEGDVYDGR
jgi:hypothetical protein